MIPEFVSTINAKDHLVNFNKRVSELISLGAIEEKIEISQQQESDK